MSVEHRTATHPAKAHVARSRLVKSLAILASLVVVVVATPARGDEILSPERFLGRKVGTDFQLADWSQISGYVDHLGEMSPRVLVRKVDKTTEGRDFRLVVISSEDNLGRLDELREYARRIADPRGLSPEAREETLTKGRLILFISCNMHSTEIASAEMSLELAHRLATSDEEPWRSARREVVVLLAPSLNPDGMERVVEWYRRIVGTPYESAGLTELYQRYAGHDNNRDWFMLSLKETRIATRLLYKEWHPQVLWDVHQQGSGRERLFVPPFRDPLNPNLDPAVMAGIGLLGQRMLLDLSRRGLTGVSTGVTYDMWWSGGNRNVPVRHNRIGILSEAASANLASPIFLPLSRLQAPKGLENGYRPSNRFPAPWPGGWWRIGDIIRYELEVARSLLGSLTRERRYWLEGGLEAAERSSVRGEKDPPFAWILPADIADRGALRRMLEILDAGGVEVHAARAAFTADEREYAAGTLVIRRAQPYGSYVKDLLEVQRYPEGLPPYDVSGWTLSLLLGVRRVEVVGRFEAELERMRSVDDALASLPRAPAKPYRWPHLDGAESSSLGDVIRLLAAGVEVFFDGTEDGRPGAWLTAGDPDTLGRVKDVLGRDLVPVDGSGTGDAPLEVDGFHQLPRLPRVGLYAPWAASMDEGWTRWVFEHFGLPYRRMRNETIRAGDLGSLVDVLVIPSVRASTLRGGRAEGTVFPRYAGGLDPEGSVAIEEFVRRGGTLIATDRSCDYVVELFDLGLENVATREKNDEEGFSCPGSILRTVAGGPSYWTAGLPVSQPVFFSNSRAFRAKKPESRSKPESALAKGRREPVETETLLEFPATRILLSGYCAKPETIARSAAWMRVPVGKGRVHLFGFRPQYRSWSHTTFPLLLRAILLDGSR